MGVLNVTPDSFSDGGRYVDLGAAAQHAADMVAQGAAVVDVGGESTRPGATPVSVDEELERVIPVVEAVVSVAPRVSVDTRREPVARAAVAAGATLINDVSASLWRVAADTGAGWIAMHMRGEPGTMQDAPRYDDVCREVFDFLDERATAAERGGVGEVWVDPGFGFGKTEAHNLRLVANIDRLVTAGRPVLLGVSRKHTLGAMTARSDGTEGPTPPGDRVEMGVALAAWAMMAGVRMIRAHDVALHVAAAQRAVERAASAPTHEHEHPATGAGSISKG